MPSNHERLTRLLEEVSPSRPNCLVLLYSYFVDVGLGAEDEITARGRHPLCLEPHPLATESETMIQLLGRLEGQVDFELLALQWLKGLDRTMVEKEIDDSCDELIFQGFDARPYRLCRRNDMVADYYNKEATWDADQSPSLATYVRFHKLVPTEPVEGRRQIECLSEYEWGYRSLHKRLRRWITANPAALRVMLWPFRVEIDYRNIEDPDSKDEIRLVRLAEVANEAELSQEIEEALAQARAKKVTVLLFPELAVPESAERHIRDVLRSHGRDGERRNLPNVGADARQLPPRALSQLDDHRSRVPRAKPRCKQPGFHLRLQPTLRHPADLREPRGYELLPRPPERRRPRTPLRQRRVPSPLPPLRARPLMSWTTQHRIK